MRISRRSLLGGLAVLPAVRLLRGQDQQRPTFSADVKVVNIFANVRDNKGQTIKGLSREDFQLEEDGRPQVIRYFSQESDLPLTVGLLVDTSGSTRNVLPDERSASQRFLRQVLREGKDSAFVIHFDFDVELLEDLTSSRARLERALDQLQPVDLRLQRTRGGYPSPRRSGGTALYDAVFLASDEVLKKRTGRKALILLSDGEDNGSKMELSAAKEAAQRADTLVYSILFEDPSGAFSVGRRFGGRIDGRKVLDKISRETGGRFVEVTRRMPMDKVFAEIEEDLRNQYSLGYSSDQTGTAGFRRIRLTTRQKGLTVQTREGYYAS